MKGIALLVLFSLVVVIACVSRADNAEATSIKTRTCAAPCVVTFRQPMREDMFCIDYRGNGTLRVWRDADTEC